jgi:ribonuclease HII
MCASPHPDVSPSVSSTSRRTPRVVSSTRQATANLALEAELWAAGYRAIAGVDEVGRGPWAGPVVAAAVILPSDSDALAQLFGKVDDSKRLTPRQREQIFGPIQQLALATGVGRVEASAIDLVGIAAATKQAMRQALAALAVQPDFALLDFLTLPDLPLPQRGVPHGDALSLSIAAASIIAKVTRDLWMAEQETNYPGYGFARHKGYGTAEHHAALRRLGPCPLHRLSFAPVAAVQASAEKIGQMAG